jgi:hypothetical protein
MTALSIPQIPSAETVGLHRRMARIADSAGRIRTIAIDHPDNYLLLFDPDLTKVSFEEVVESKLEMIAVLSRHATSVLADPVYCFGQSIVTGALPGDVRRSSRRSAPTPPSSWCSTGRTVTPPTSRTSTRSWRRPPGTATPWACP